MLQAELDAVRAAQRIALSGVMAALEDGLVASGAVQRSKRTADADASMPAAKKPRLFDLDSFEIESDLSDSDSQWSEPEEGSGDDLAAGVTGSSSADSDQDVVPKASEVGCLHGLHCLTGLHTSVLPCTVGFGRCSCLL